jgi:hypothetical protein
VTGPAPQTEPGTSATRGNRWRTRLEVAAVTLGLLALLWGSDALARLGAESLLERNVQDATGVATRPQVHVQGTFFLPQVIRGAYRHVDVTTEGLTSGPLRVEHVQSRLTDVRVPFHDVLVQDIRRVGVSRSQERVTLRHSDLNAYFAATGRPLRVSEAEDGGLTVEGRVNVLGRQVLADADVQLSVQDETLRISPDRIDTGSTALDQASRLLLTQRLTLTVPLGTLPFGHRLTDVRTEGDLLVLDAEGYGVILQP